MLLRCPKTQINIMTQTKAYCQQNPFKTVLADWKNILNIPDIYTYCIIVVQYDTIRILKRRRNVALYIKIIDPEIVRLDKLESYFNHFDVGNRYGISFKEFVRKVEAGTWVAYLAS
jgi:hypothetical protein